MAPGPEEFGAPTERKGMSTLAKVGIGCAIVALICCLFAGYGLIKFIGWGKEIQEHMQEVMAAPGTEVAALLAQAEEGNPFTEPDVPTATAERVETFLGVREQVLPSARGWEEFMEQAEAGEVGGWDAFKKGMAMFEDWAGVRKAFGRALTEKGMSEAEYVYLFRLAYLSGVVEVEDHLEGQMRFDVEGFGDVPEETRAVIGGFSDRIAENGISFGDVFILGQDPQRFQAR